MRLDHLPATLSDMEVRPELLLARVGLQQLLPISRDVDVWGRAAATINIVTRPQ